MEFTVAVLFIVPRAAAETFPLISKLTIEPGVKLPMVIDPVQLNQVDPLLKEYCAFKISAASKSYRLTSRATEGPIFPTLKL